VTNIKKHQSILLIGKAQNKVQGYFTTLQLKKSLVSWQNVNREEVKQEFRDGGSVAFSASSTLEMHPVVVLGGGDTERVSCALGKENMAGAHCNHCNRATKRFHLGRGELWTLASLAAMARRF
jgi:hypothetical protein